MGASGSGSETLLAILATAQAQLKALIANVLVGAWKVIPLIVVSYGVGLGIEFLFAGMRGHSINEGYLVSGMLIPLIMPVDVPLWMVVVAVVVIVFSFRLLGLFFFFI